MPQAQNKTQPTNQDVQTFLHAIEDEQQRRDSQELCRIMGEITGQTPKMWGPSIVGFGQYHYKYASGREGDAAAIGFSPRKGKIVVYVVDGFSLYRELLEQLGPHKTAKVCLYIKRLSDVNINILRKIIELSYQYVTTHKNDMHRAE